MIYFCTATRPLCCEDACGMRSACSNFKFRLSVERFDTGTFTVAYFFFGIVAASLPTVFYAAWAQVPLLVPARQNADRALLCCSLQISRLVRIDVISFLFNRGNLLFFIKCLLMFTRFIVCLLKANIVQLNYPYIFISERVHS